MQSRKSHLSLVKIRSLFRILTLFANRGLNDLGGGNPEAVLSFSTWTAPMHADVVVKMKVSYMGSSW